MTNLSPKTSLPPSAEDQADVDSTTGFKLTHIAEVLTRSIETDWLIKGLIPSDSMGMIFGKPASGKSLIAMDMAYCVGLGREYHGYPVKQGAVVYIAGEGHAGINRRFKALSVYYEIEPDNVHVSEIPMDLYSSKSRLNVLEAISNISDIALIVIDTLHRNSSGDENSAKDFAKVMQSCDLLRKATGATILLVHHNGHDGNSRGRGSSSINAALDVEYQVQKEGAHVTMSNTKTKDIKVPSDISFTMNAINIGKSTGGDDIDAPILVEGRVGKSPCKLTPEDLAILSTLKELVLSGEACSNDFIDSTGGQIVLSEEQLMVSKSDWISASKDQLKVSENSLKPDEARRKRFSRSLDRLYISGRVAKNSGDYFIVPAISSSNKGGK